MRKYVSLILMTFGIIPSLSFGAECVFYEYSKVGTDAVGQAINAPNEPRVAKQAVTYTSSTQSSKFNSRTTYIMVKCDAEAYWEIGTNPTAVATSSISIPADTLFYISLDYQNVDVSDYEIAFYDGTS